MIAALLLHLGEGTEMTYGVSPIVVAFAAFWFVVAVVAIWRGRGVDERSSNYRAPAERSASSAHW